MTRVGLPGSAGRQIAAEALRLRVWCRSRLVDGIHTSAPAAGPRAWRIFLQHERCAALLDHSLQRYPAFGLPDHASALIDAFATSGAISSIRTQPDNTVAIAPEDHVWTLLSQLTADTQTPARMNDLLVLRDVLAECDVHARARLNARIAAATRSRDLRLIIAAIDRPRNTLAAARHYLFLARVGSVDAESRAEGTLRSRARNRLTRGLARAITADVGLLRRKPERFTTRLKKSLIGTTFSGFRLGVMTRQQLTQRSMDYYSAGKEGEHIDYSGDAHNCAGWFPWERALIQSWFPDRGRVLVIAAGGGREMLSLLNAGYTVDGFECHPGLAAAGTQLLRRMGFSAGIAVAQPDHAPATGAVYDAAIIGWSAYTLVQGRDQRITMLGELHAQVAAHAPLMLSFFPRGPDDRARRNVLRAANVFRRLRRIRDLEEGDTLGEVFTHRFTRAEIQAELAAAGWSLVAFGTEPTGYAVARRCDGTLAIGSPP